MAYLMIARKQYEDPSFAGWYNVGPDDCDCVTTGELTTLFCQAWGDGMTWENRSPRGELPEAGLLQNQNDLRLDPPLAYAGGHPEDGGVVQGLDGRRGCAGGDAEADSGV